MMELRDLEYFLACVESGSITAAARRVHAAQPTISHALLRLERDVGERLLDRSPRSPVRPTEAGELLIEHARRALAALDGFKQALSELRGELRGTLRVVAIPSLCASLLPRVLARLSESHPGIDVRVRTLAAERVPPAVASARADIGLLAGAPLTSLRGLEVQELYSERMVVVVRRDHAFGRRRSLKLTSLRDQPLLLPPSGTFTSVIIHDACRQAGFEPRLRLTLASAEALRESVREGLGLAILPEGYLRTRDPELCALRLTHPTPTRQVLLVQRALGATNTPRAARVFVATVERVVCR